VPGRTPEYDLQEQECEIRWCSLIVLHIENRCTSATIPNYRHSQRRSVLIFFHTIRGFASRETACPRYPHVLPHPHGDSHHGPVHGEIPGKNRIRAHSPFLPGNRRQRRSRGTASSRLSP